MSNSCRIGSASCAHILSAFFKARQEYRQSLEILPKLPTVARAFASFATLEQTRTCTHTYTHARTHDEGIRLAGDLTFVRDQVTKRQLMRSIDEGLAAAAGDADSFESVQRRLLAAVQLASARQGAAHNASGAAVQEALRKLFPNSYMCGKCGFGPGTALPSIFCVCLHLGLLSRVL